MQSHHMVGPYNANSYTPISHDAMYGKSSFFWPFFCRMLEKDPKRRPTVQEIMARDDLRSHMECARSRALELQPDLVLPPFLPASQGGSLSAEQPWTPETTQVRSRLVGVADGSDKGASDADNMRAGVFSAVAEQGKAKASGKAEAAAAATAAPAGLLPGGVDESDAGARGLDEGAWGSSVDRLEQGSSSDATASGSGPSRGSSSSPTAAAAAEPIEVPGPGHGLLPFASSSTATATWDVAAVRRRTAPGVRQPGIAATPAERVQAAIGMAHRQLGGLNKAPVEGSNKQQRPFSSPGGYASSALGCRGSEAGVPATAEALSTVPCGQQAEDGLPVPGAAAVASAGAGPCLPEASAIAAAASATQLDLDRRSKRGWRDAQGAASPRTRPASAAGGPAAAAAQAGSGQRRRTTGGVLSTLGPAARPSSQPQQQRQPTPKRAAAGLERLAAAATGAAEKGILFTKGRGSEPTAAKAGLVKARHHHPRATSAAGAAGPGAAAAGLVGSSVQSNEMQASQPVQQRARVQSAGGVVQRACRRVSEMASAGAASKERGGSAGSGGGSPATTTTASSSSQPQGQGSQTGWDLNGRRRVLRRAGSAAIVPGTGFLLSLAPESAPAASSSLEGTQAAAAGGGGGVLMGNGICSEGHFGLTPVQPSPQAGPSSSQPGAGLTPVDADALGEAIRKLSFGNTPPTTTCSSSSFSPALGPIPTSGSFTVAPVPAVPERSSAGGASGSSSPRTGLSKQQTSWRRPKQPHGGEEQQGEPGIGEGSDEGSMGEVGLFEGHLLQQQQPSRIGSGNVSRYASSKAATASTSAAAVGTTRASHVGGEGVEQHGGQLHEFRGSRRTSSCQADAMSGAATSQPATAAAPSLEGGEAVVDMSAAAAFSRSSSSRSCQTLVSASAAAGATVLQEAGVEFGQLQERMVLGNVLTVVAGLLHRG